MSFTLKGNDTKWIISTCSGSYIAKSLQSCPTLCDPRDGSPPGSPIPGILQARTLEWVAISFSSAWKWKVKGKSLSRVRLLATPWTTAYQAPPSIGFSRQEYWSGVPWPSPPLSIVVSNTSLLAAWHYFHFYSAFSFLFFFLRNCWSVLQRDFSNLDYHQQCVRVLVAPHSGQYLLWLVF